MKDIKLNVDERKPGKKSELKALRRKGQIPGIFYTSGEEPLPVVLDYKEFAAALHSGNHVFAMDIRGKTRRTIIKQVQYHPVTDQILHVDIFGVTKKSEIEITLPVEIKGTPIGVKDFGGFLEQHMRVIPLKCPIDDVPEQVVIDVSDLNIGDSISVKDIDVGKSRILFPEDTVVISVIAGRAEKVEEEAEEEAELEEGEEESGETESE